MNMSVTSYRLIQRIIVSLLFFFCFIPLAQADVLFSEVAWMGTTVDSNDEWIEIYNFSSTPTDLTGWTLSDGKSLNIVLSGVMPPHGVFVLERTDDMSVPSVTAAVIYTGALTNSGATLTFRDADGVVMGTPLVGGADWVNIGGDNASKYSAQVTRTGQWVTGHQTPGLPNVEADELPDDTDDTDDDDDSESDTNTDDDDDGAASESSGGGSSGTPTVFYTTPRPLLLALTIPDRAYINQEISASASGGGLSEVILNSLSYDWNFGDFNTGQGKEVTHRFAYPGTYVVTVHGQFKEYEASVRKTITVLPVNFSITTNTHGDVQVHNDASYEVDMSGYKITSGKTLQFPEGTILLPKATITIPKKQLKYTNSATLFDDMATQLASVVSKKTVTATPRIIAKDPISPPAPIAYAPTITPKAVASTNFNFTQQKPPNPKVEVQPPLETVALVAEGVSQVAAPIEAAKDIPSEKLPYFALLGVIGLGITAVFAGRVKQK